MVIGTFFSSFVYTPFTTLGIRGEICETHKKFLSSLEANMDILFKLNDIHKNYACVVLARQPRRGGQFKGH